jgi:hypothetical protein
VPDTALEAIEQALLEGALAHGFATDQPGMRRHALTIAGHGPWPDEPVAFAIESPPELGCRMPA